MMKTLFVVLLFMSICVAANGQVVLYSTDFGTTETSAGTLTGGWVASGASSTNFSANISSTSTGYSSPFSASGSANLSEGVTGKSIGSSYVTLGGQINTINIVSIQVGFAYRASSAGYPGTVTLQWSIDNGNNWADVTIGALTFDGNWRAINSGNWINLPNTVENVSDLQFRFVFVRSASSTQNFRIDDFYVRGIVPGGSQPSDYFRSKQLGDWNTSSTWESSTNNSSWVNSTLVPTSTANAITIRNGHTVTINNAASADQLTIQAGGLLNHTSGKTFALNDGTGDDMTINGTYTINGSKPAGAGTCVVNSNGVVKADNNSGGESDDFAFSTNAKVLFKTGSVFEWNSSIFSTSDITYFNSATEKPTFRITSNVGNVGSGSATVINGLLEVNGSVTWDDVGTKTFRDGITGSGTITQSPTSGTLTIAGSISAILGGTGAINLSNAGMQIASGASVVLQNNKPVNNSNFINYGTLECQTFAITGSTTFTNSDLATLFIGSPQGITASGATGNIQTSGRVFNSNASYIYYSNIDQATGNGLPLTVSILSISSSDLTGSNTITLTNNNTTVTNSFNLNNGYFAAGTGANLQIASGGTIFGKGGHNPGDASAGNIIFLGSGSTVGTLTGYPKLYSVIINGAVDFNGSMGQSATILNKLQLNSGSSVSDAPYYQTSSSLVYSTGGTYNRNVEWGSASGQGYPHHVTVQGNTILDLHTVNNVPASLTSLAMAGNLTIGNASGWGRLYMNNMTMPLSVGGNLTIASLDAASVSSVLQLSSSIGGDLWLYADFTRYINGFYNDNERAIFFKGNSNSSINTPDVTITPGTPTQYFSYAIMDKTNGTETVTLNCPVGIDHAMTFKKGIVWSSKDHPLVFIDGATVSDASNLSFVNGPVKKIGDDIFLFPIGKPLRPNPSVGGYRYIGIAPAANNSATDAFTAEFMQASATALGPVTASGLTRVSRCEYWKLDNTNLANSPTIHITASWTVRSNCNVVGTVPYISDLPKLVLAHFNGTSWDSYGGNTRTGNEITGTITWNNVSVFSPFSLGSTDFLENLLPLDVSGFNARARTTDVAIDWMVSNNNDQNEFILERSRDGMRFETLKIVPVKVILFTAAYVEEDKHPFKGWNYFRLRVVNKLGIEKVSKTVKVWFGREQEIRISPNPASEKITLSFAEPSSISQIELVNISGQVLQRTQTIKFNNEMNIAHLQAGMYYLRIIGKSGLSTKSFIKQ